MCSVLKILHVEFGKQHYSRGSLNPVLQFARARGIKLEKRNYKQAIMLIISIYLWHYSPSVGPWPLFQFLNPRHRQYDPLDGG
jgi:hypothetical protein